MPAGIPESVPLPAATSKRGLSMGVKIPGPDTIILTLTTSAGNAYSTFASEFPRDELLLAFQTSFTAIDPVSIFVAELVSLVALVTPEEVATSVEPSEPHPAVTASKAVKRKKLLNIGKYAGFMIVPL